MVLALLLSWAVVAPVGVDEDPFAAPPELVEFARSVTPMGLEPRDRLDALMQAVFRPQESGGLGMQYDSSYTRTVREAWRDRKANCLTLTALCLAACHAVGLDARFAEVLGASAWSREGNLVRQELHIVALVPATTLKNELVIDFDPRVRERLRSHSLNPLPEARARALFYSNRAAELLAERRLDEALLMAQSALTDDPELSIGWNVHGLVLKALGRRGEAESAYRTAVRADPGDANVLNNLEILLREQGRTAEADRVRKDAHTLRERNPYYQYFLADEALAAGDLDVAMERIKQAIKRHKHEPQFFVTQARVFVAQGKMDDATESLERARAVAKDAERQRYDLKLTQLREHLAASEEAGP